MRQTIAIGMLGVALFCNTVIAQTAVEQAQILREFEDSVAAIPPATPAPKIFTLPVAMVFRQLIARALVAGESGAAIGSVYTVHHPAHLQLVREELREFPKVLKDALPRLPAPLEYRLIDNDLVIRNVDTDTIIGVLREALDTAVTQHR